MSKERKKRIDKNHRFTIRIDEVHHYELDALHFSHRISLNLIYVEAIKFAKMNPAFLQYLKDEFPVDDRRGHYVYHKNTKTMSAGRIL